MPGGITLAIGFFSMVCATAWRTLSSSNGACWTLKPRNQIPSYCAANVVVPITNKRQLTAIILLANLKDVIPFRINCYNGWKINDLERLDRLGAELGVGDDGRLLDVFREQRRDPARDDEVDRFIFFHRLDDLSAPLPLADHGFQPFIEQGRSEGIHPAGSCRPHRADDSAGLRPRRRGIEKYLAFDVEGRVVLELLVRRVPGHIKLPRNEDALPRPQGFDIRVG